MHTYHVIFVVSAHANSKISGDAEILLDKLFANVSVSKLGVNQPQISVIATRIYNLLIVQFAID